MSPLKKGKFISKRHNYKPFAEGIPLGKAVNKNIKLLLTLSAAGGLSRGLMKPK
ncbi:MAG: hypothetical protein IH819_09700 [Bacteroidetes bacterium]|nr:hypothetical protein [Bacteroidota bacterium]